MVGQEVLLPYDSARDRDPDGSHRLDAVQTARGADSPAASGPSGGTHDPVSCAG